MMTLVEGRTSNSSPPNIRGCRIGGGPRRRLLLDGLRIEGTLLGRGLLLEQAGAEALAPTDDLTGIRSGSGA